MYRKNVQPTSNASNPSKKVNKSTDRSVPVNDKNRQTQSDFKNKDEQLLQLIKQHLLSSGYLRSFEVLKNERPNIKAKAQIGSHQPRNELDKNTAMNLYEKGSREEFFKVTNKMWNTHDENVRKLEFQLQVYFCIYNVHPCLKKQNLMLQSASQAFKKYLDQKSSDRVFSQEELSLFALPYMNQPQLTPAIAYLFTKDWIAKIKNKLAEQIQAHLKSSSISQQQNSQIRKTSGLQEIYYTHLNSSINSSREDFKENCNHSLEMEALKQQNSELRTIIQNYHKKFDQFTESSKMNLLESNQKWFYFSRDLFTIARKFIREDKVKILQKYQSFFVGNVEDLIEANQISLFDKNSYMYDDLSVNPDASKQKIPAKSKQNAPCQPCQLDLNKIKSLFLQANIKDKEVEICSVLRALKNRYNKNPAAKRREIIVEYSRGDICGVKEENYVVQKRLFFDGTERIREFFVKLLEVITTDVVGLQYLNKSKKLVQNLVGIFSNERQQNKCFKPIVGILQRLSFSKEPRRQMIDLGIIPMIFKVFKNEGSELSGFTLQFLTAMMMNLSLKKESRPDFEKYKAELISIVIEHMTSENNQVRDYINGSIFLLLTSKSIKEEALRQKLDLIVKSLLENKEDQMCSQQYNYILKRITGEEEPELCQDSDSDQEEEGQMEQYQEYEDQDCESLSGEQSDDYIEGEIQIANGEEILFKNYALLGPQAVREHILTRSVLDETSKRLNNMTTSINRSRRMDNIFVQKGNATVLEPQLDCLLNRKKV